MKRFRFPIQSRFFICLCTVSTMLTTGCWDAQEPNQLGIVVGIGIDRLESGKIHLTLSGINTVGGQASGKDKSGGGQSPVSNLEVSGNTLEDAFALAEARASRHPYYAHNSVIVFGSNFAKDGYAEAITFLQRNRTFRQSQVLLVTSGSPSEVLSSDVGIETTPALGLRDLAEAKDNTYAYESTGLEDSNARIAPSHTSILSRVEVDEMGRDVVSTVGVFDSGKLKYFASKEESRGLLWLLNKVHRGSIALSQSKNIGEEPTTVRLLSIHCQTIPHVNGNEPTFTIRVRGIGELIHITHSDKIQTTESVQDWNRQTEKKIKEELSAAVTKTQSRNIDAPQFGTEIFRTNPVFWRKIATQWPETFPHVKVNYDIQINLIRAGLLGDNPEKFIDPKMLPPEKGR